MRVATFASAPSWTPVPTPEQQYCATEHEVGDRFAFGAAETEGGASTLEYRGQMSRRVDLLWALEGVHRLFGLGSGRRLASSSALLILFFGVCVAGVGDARHTSEKEERRSIASEEVCIGGGRREERQNGQSPRRGWGCSMHSFSHLTPTLVD